MENVDALAQIGYAMGYGIVLGITYGFLYFWWR